MEINERDLYTFLIVAGLWLKDRQPPVVRRSQEVAKECGIYTSSPLFLKALERLVDKKMLAPVPYGKGMHRYVPTPRGLIDSHMIITTSRNRNESVAKYLSCLAKHVDVRAVARVSHILLSLYAYAPFIAWHKWPILGLSQEARTRLRDLLHAISHNIPIDVHDVDLIVQLEPVLNCNFEYYALHSALQLITSSETDSTPELVVAIQKILEAMAKLARRCATHKGIQPFGTVANQLESFLCDKFNACQ